jgi:hypothetical protein
LNDEDEEGACFVLFFGEKILGSERQFAADFACNQEPSKAGFFAPNLLQPV